ncbi:MAG: AAA family ATPase, partial [Anaerolineae bacterium]
SVLVVDDIPETRENLKKLLYFESDIDIAGMAASGQEAVDMAQKLRPHIVLMDINMPDMDGISASQEITRAAPGSQVIMMSVQSEADYLRRSMLAGAMDFLTKPFSSEELTSSIRRVYQMGAERRATTPATPAAKEERPEGSGSSQGRAGRSQSTGKLLLVYSPKGGTGCSTVACNLAIALHQVTSKEVGLVDASLQFGSIDVLLNLQGNRSIADAVGRDGELEGDLLSALTAPHPSGIRVLAAPPTPEMSEAIGADQIKAILLQMIRTLDYVIVDTWSYLDDIVLAAMDLADRIVVVMTPEIPSVKGTKQFLEVAEALEFPLEQVDLVLNKVVARDGIRADQLEGSMHQPVRAQIEYEPKVMRQAVNQGLPLAMAMPNHPLAERFAELAQHEVSMLHPEPVAETEKTAEAPRAKSAGRTSLFGRLKK